VLGTSSANGWSSAATATSNRRCGCAPSSSKTTTASRRSSAFVGLALLIFGLIEAELRRRLGDEQLPGLLPEGRPGPATGRNILAAFQGLGLTYTADAIVLDRLTPTQRRVLELLEIDVP
jgi:hypothetical protein